MTFLPMVRLAHGYYKPDDTSSQLTATGAGDPTTSDVLVSPVPFVKVIRPASDEHPEVWREEHTAPTLNAFDNGSESRATVLAFDSTWSIQSTVSADPSPTIKVGSGLGIASPPAVLAFEPMSALDENWAQTDTKNTLRAEASRSSHALVSGAAVRRLTPLECERLQGFNDNWTRWRADGTEQSDSARYKQMGNAVAVPVAAWVGLHIAKATQ